MPDTTDNNNMSVAVEYGVPWSSSSFSSSSTSSSSSSMRAAAAAAAVNDATITSSGDTGSCHSARRRNTNTMSSSSSSMQQQQQQQQQTRHFMVGMGRVSRDDFLDRFDMGYPRDETSPYNEEVLILYGSSESLPLAAAKPPQQQQQQQPPATTTTTKGVATIITTTTTTTTTTNRALSNAMSKTRDVNEKDPSQNDGNNDEDKDKRQDEHDNNNDPDDDNEDDGSIPYYDSIEAATENCGILKIVQTNVKPEKSSANAPEEAHQECIAIVGQWSSYHVQKWTRPDHKRPWRPVPTHYRSDVPSRNDTIHSLDTLHRYWSVFPSAQAQLAPLAYRVARGGHGNSSSSHVNPTTTASSQQQQQQQQPAAAGPIIVMVTNAGQLHLWINFVCSARARRLDLSHILLFATDATTHDWVQHHTPEIAVFYHQGIFASIPQHAAVDYHDVNYGRIMMAKVYSVHLINSLGYDVLFQDLDVVWYQHPLRFFEQKFQNALISSGNSSTT